MSDDNISQYSSNIDNTYSNNYTSKSNNYSSYSEKSDNKDRNIQDVLDNKSDIKKNNISDYSIIKNVTELLRNNIKTVNDRIGCHNIENERYERYDKIMGYPITLLSIFISSSIMFNINANDKSVAVEIMGLIISFILSFLSVSREFLNYARKGAEHKVSCKLYTTLLRNIETRLMKNELTNVEKKEIFRDLVAQISLIEQYELPIKSKTMERVRKNSIHPLDKDLTK